jgi:hypothetical protein
MVTKSAGAENMPVSIRNTASDRSLIIREVVTYFHVEIPVWNYFVLYQALQMDISLKTR